MTAGAAELTGTATTARTTAPAKINLTLEILGRRDDGFHNLRSIVIGVDLCDDVRMSLGRRGGVTLECDEPALANRENLAALAGELIARRSGGSSGLRLRLIKCIPIAAGLGGGSSDAAAALRLANELFGVGLSRDDLSALGAELGSDVPLFFHLPSAVMTGRGEEVKRVSLRWSGSVLLALAPIPVSTRAVYEAWRPPSPAGSPRHAPKRLLEVGRADELSPLLFNDLEPAVFAVCPQVAELFDLLQKLDMGSFRVSGAGSTFFRLFDEREDAVHAARIIEERIPTLRCVVAAGPVDVGNISYEEH